MSWLFFIIEILILVIVGALPVYVLFLVIKTCRTYIEKNKKI
jgi:hypothetical protein